jgi:integrase
MAIRKSHEVKTREGTKSRTIKKVSYWDHHSFPEPSALKRRLPISTANIEKLRQAVGTMSTSPHQRMRRHCTLKLLEVTGARRGEIALIETQFVKNAGEMEMPMLRVPTLKKRRSSPPYRFVPISRSDIEFIMQYVEVHRRAVVRRKLRGQSDHGFLLVGEDGMPYQPNSITQEVRKLARHAGIDEVACPHMFRHRFFTKLFVALIEQHQSENPDCFRQLLIDGESLKRKVLEWSGQSSIESLDHYIDLAFDEIGNYKKVYNLANVGLALDSFQGTLEAEMQAIGQGEAPFLVAERLIRQITSLRNALDAAKAVA